MLDRASIGAFLNLTDGNLDRLAGELSELEPLELDHLEVWLEHQPTGRELSAIARLLDGWVTIMHGPFVGMSLSTDWEALAAISLERCHRAIEAAGVLDSRVVTLHAGAYGDFSAHEAALERLAARITRFLRIPRPVVTVENMPARGGVTREAVATASDLEAILERLPDAQLTFDVGHSLQNGEDPVEFFQRHRTRIANIHLHDGWAGGRAHQALGAGELALGDLVERMHTDGYSGFVSIETLSREDLESSLAALAALDVRPGRGAKPLGGGMPQAA